MLRDKIIEYIIEYFKSNGLMVAKKALIALAIFIACYIIAKQIVKKVKKRIEANEISSDTYAKRVSWLIGSMVFVVLMIFTVLIVFQVIGVEVGLLMWWLSLGIGFAMENTITNMISWVAMLTNPKIRIWDKLEIQGNINLVWFVKEINVRYTVIQAINWQRVIIPNNKMWAVPVKTFSQEDLIRWEVELKVPRHTSIPQVKQLLVETTNKHENVINKQFTNVTVSGFDESGIKLKLFFLYNPSMGKTDFVINSDLRPELVQVLRQYGITVPYHHITIDSE